MTKVLLIQMYLYLPLLLDELLLVSIFLEPWIG